MRAIVLPEPWKAVTAEREIPVPTGRGITENGLRGDLRK